LTKGLEFPRPARFTGSPSKKTLENSAKFCISSPSWMNNGCEVSIVMPCLNEADTLATCIKKAKLGLERTGARGEIVVADNGSTDSSIEIANREGARVVHVKEKGYGMALRGGIQAAAGK